MHDDEADSADGIWDRAAVERGGPSPHPRDAALSAVLALHNLPMSGGLLDAVEQPTDSGPGYVTALKGKAQAGRKAGPSGPLPLHCLWTDSMISATSR